MGTLKLIIRNPSHLIRSFLARIAGQVTFFFLKRKQGQLYSIQSAQFLIYQKNENTADSARYGHQITSRMLHPETSYIRPHPIYTNKNISWDKTPQKVPQLYLYSISEAFVSNLGVISTINGNIIAESAEQFVSNKHNPDGFIRIHENNFALQEIKSAKIFHGENILLINKHSDNYGHFILECLPNIRLLKEIPNLADAKVVIHKTLNPALRQALFESLELADIKESQIIEFGNKGEIGIFEKLHYPSPITGHPTWKSEVAVRFCENLAEKIINSNTKQIHRNPSSDFLYISRSTLYKRRPTNEEEVIETLVSHGFDVIYPETISVQEQIIIFSRAKIIVGILGAAMTNIVFSPNNTQIIMLIPDSISGHFFWDLASLKHQAYYAVFCKIVSQQRGYGDADFYVDINELNEALAIAYRMAEG